MLMQAQSKLAQASGCHGQRRRRRRQRRQRRRQAAAHRSGMVPPVLGLLDLPLHAAANNRSHQEAAGIGRGSRLCCTGRANPNAGKLRRHLVVGGESCLSCLSCLTTPHAGWKERHPLKAPLDPSLGSIILTFPIVSRVTAFVHRQVAPASLARPTNPLPPNKPCENEARHPSAGLGRGRQPLPRAR